MIRYFIIFTGRVQGVGFRYFVAQIAKSLKMTGQVRNLSNGNVEVEIQGKTQDFDLFLQRLLKGNGFINIKDYSLKEIPTKPSEEKFTIKG